MLTSLAAMMNKPWLKLILPALIVVFGLLGTAFASLADFGDFGDFARGHSVQPASHPHQSRIAARPQASSAHMLSSVPHSRHDPGQPLFLLAPLIEDAEEEAELSPKGLFTLLGVTLLCGAALALKRLEAHARARMYQAAFRPLAGGGHSPLFLQLQVFRL